MGARDQGPGIVDLETAMRDGYSTSKSLGMGLPGAKRLMDQFEIRSLTPGGTTVSMTKWRILDELERLREDRHADARPDERTV